MTLKSFAECLCLFVVWSSATQNIVKYTVLFRPDVHARDHFFRVGVGQQIGKIKRKLLVRSFENGVFRILNMWSKKDSTRISPVALPLSRHTFKVQLECI